MTEESSLWLFEAVCSWRQLNKEDRRRDNNAVGQVVPPNERDDQNSWLRCNKKGDMFWLCEQLCLPIKKTLYNTTITFLKRMWWNKSFFIHLSLGLDYNPYGLGPQPPYLKKKTDPRKWYQISWTPEQAISWETLKAGDTLSWVIIWWKEDGEKFMSHWGNRKGFPQRLRLQGMDLPVPLREFWWNSLRIPGVPQVFPACRVPLKKPQTCHSKSETNGRLTLLFFLVRILKKKRKWWQVLLLYGQVKTMKFLNNGDT